MTLLYKIQFNPICVPIYYRKQNRKVFMHPDILWPQCEDDVKWVGNFFYRSSLSCFFLEKFRFERYANILLIHHSA